MNALTRSASTVTASTATYDVFISYSHADRDWVRDALQPRLESWGLCVGVDHQNFLPGRRLAGTIREFIRASRHVIFVCTKAFADSEWCREELQTVRAEDPAGLRAKAIPVVLEEGFVPDLLSDVIWCNLTANPYDEQEWQKLCAAMGGNWQDSYLEVKEVIQNAIETEFNAYRSLPLIDTARLATYFNPAGSAYQRIVHLLSRHRERGWIISNPGNPSTALLLEIAVHQLARRKYEVRTKEYWYLRWFSLEENRYRTIYNETNDQMYLVEDVNGVLRVNANIYPCTKPPLVLRVLHNIRRLWMVVHDKALQRTRQTAARR